MQNIAEGWYEENLRPLSYVNFEITGGDAQRKGPEFNEYLHKVLKDLEHMNVTVTDDSVVGGNDLSLRVDDGSDSEEFNIMSHVTTEPIEQRILVIGDGAAPTASTSDFTVSVHGGTVHSVKPKIDVEPQYSEEFAEMIETPEDVVHGSSESSDLSDAPKVIEPVDVYDEFSIERYIENESGNSN